MRKRDVSSVLFHTFLSQPPMAEFAEYNTFDGQDLLVADHLVLILDFSSSNGLID